MAEIKIKERLILIQIFFNFKAVYKISALCLTLKIKVVKRSCSNGFNDGALSPKLYNERVINSPINEQVRCIIKLSLTMLPLPYYRFTVLSAAGHKLSGLNLACKRNAWKTNCPVCRSTRRQYVLPTWLRISRAARENTEKYSRSQIRDPNGPISSSSWDENEFLIP